MLLKRASCHLLLLALGLAVVAGCGPRKNKKSGDFVEEPLPQLTNFSISSERITIMAWNMENLFDTEDDPETDDDTFLPLDLKKTLQGHEAHCNKAGAYSWIQQCLLWDWNEKALALKLSRLGEVIRSVNGGRGPDLLIVSEIENLNVLNRLINEHLPGMGYTAYLHENHDYRGIDVGLISRLTPVEEPHLKELRSRPGLVTQFHLDDGAVLNLIGVHLPISPTPVAKRLEMLANIKTMADENPDQFTLVTGDFNFPAELQKEYNLVKKYLKPDWVVGQLYMKDCKGTFYDSYSSEWSFLDMFLLSKNFFNKDATWTLDPKSVHIHNPLPFQIAEDGSPNDFDLPDMLGVSDHFPIVMQLVKTDR